MVSLAARYIFHLVDRIHRFHVSLIIQRCSTTYLSIVVRFVSLGNSSVDRNRPYFISPARDFELINFAGASRNIKKNRMPGSFNGSWSSTLEFLFHTVPPLSLRENRVATNNRRGKFSSYTKHFFPAKAGAKDFDSMEKIDRFCIAFQDE